MRCSWRLVPLLLIGIAFGSSAVAAQTVTLLNSFSLNSARGKGNVSNLVADGAGALYGTTYGGGAYGYGTVFKLTPPASPTGTWRRTVLHSFCAESDCVDGSYPSGGLILVDGALYGMTQYGGLACGESGCGTIYKLVAPSGGNAGWTFEAIYSFQPPPSSAGIPVDGTNPLGGLTADANGVLYGTTEGGGRWGKGTIFRMPQDTGRGWNEVPLYAFGGSEINDGKFPRSTPILGDNGVLYGTTYEGGANGGYGTVYSVSPPAAGQTDWSETVLYSFSGGSDGAYPTSTMTYRTTPERGGALYGTTNYAGANCYADTGCGTVFSVAPPASSGASWTLTTLHSFNYNYPDGQYPIGGVVFGSNGALYGTTEYGGSNGGTNGGCDFLQRCGTIFEMEDQGDGTWSESVIYKFCDASTNQFCTTGASPTAGLTLLNDAFYGTTSYQGDGYACDCGTIFQLGQPTSQVEAEAPGPSDVPSSHGHRGRHAKAWDRIRAD
jgi:uncharacterized repeat protein (TIGR03803 family)